MAYAFSALGAFCLVTAGTNPTLYFQLGSLVLSTVNRDTTRNADHTVSDRLVQQTNKPLAESVKSVENRL